MPVIETITLVSALIKVTDKLMDKIPDYDQRKRQEFKDLHLELTEELARVKGVDRDDDKVMNLRDQLRAHCVAFAQEIA